MDSQERFRCPVSSYSHLDSLDSGGGPRDESINGIGTGQGMHRGRGPTKSGRRGLGRDLGPGDLVDWRVMGKGG